VLNAQSLEEKKRISSSEGRRESRETVDSFNRRRQIRSGSPLHGSLVDGGDEDQYLLL